MINIVVITAQRIVRAGNCVFKFRWGKVDGGPKFICVQHDAGALYVVKKVVGNLKMLITQ